MAGYIGHYETRGSLIMTSRMRVTLCLLAFLPLACAAEKTRITELDLLSSA